MTAEEPEPNTGQEASPTPLGALALTLAATFLTWGFFIVLLPAAGPTFALAVGTTVGLGLIAALASRGVPAPADFGLRGLRPGLVGALLLLVPAVVVTSEIDNVVAEVLPRPAALEEASPKGRGEDAAPGSVAPDPDAPGAAALPEEGADADAWMQAADPEPPQKAEGVDFLTALEILLFAALLRPVLEEFFFRGVLHQGLARSAGAGRAIVATALLFALLRSSFGAGNPYAMTTLGAQAFAEGLVLGGLRVATGSIFAGVGFQALTQSVGLVAVSFAAALPLAGFNAEGDHTPGTIVVLCALAVAAGLALAFRVGPAPEPEPPAAMPDEP